MRGDDAKIPVTGPEWRRQLSRFRRSRAGSVAVEGAFAITIILGMMVPMIDFGQYISLKLTLAQAIRAGGQYVLSDTTWKTDSSDANYGTDTLPVATLSALQTVVQSASGIAQTLTITVSDLQCYCASALTTEVDCIGHVDYIPCLDDSGTASQDEAGAPGHYLTITASGIFNPFLPSVPWFSTGMTVTERLVLRIN